MDYLSVYCNNVLKPLEYKIKELKEKLYNNNFLDSSNKILYENKLKEHEELLFEKYICFGNMIKEDLEYQKSISETE